MDQLGRIESKLDALLGNANVTWQEPAPPAPPELTEAQKQAIANAPVVKVPESNAGLVFTGNQPVVEPVTEEQRAAQRAQALANAPVVKVPGQETAPSGAEPPADIASVTVETEQPDGESDETTIPSSGATPPAIPKRR